ncbi:MAG: protein translocase subunit SecD, partial [Myxococcota bacterium]|nr:protein translocase subunit SecD [Myxococcota bacterium]
MGKQGTFSTIALWALVVLTFCYTLPTMVGFEKLPAWYTSMFSQQLNYGLDLQGGLELRYTVDWKKAIADNSRKLGDTVEQRLVEELAKAENKNANDLPREEWDAYANKVDFEVVDYTISRLSFESADLVDKFGKTLVTQVDPTQERFNINQVDERTFEVVLVDTWAQNIRDEAVKKTRQLISQRVEAFGLVDPDVRIAGDSDIVVQIPGVGADQMDVVRQRIGQTAQLMFRMVDRQATFFAGQAEALASYKANNPDRLAARNLELVTQSNTGPYFKARRKSELIRFLRTLEIPDDHTIGYEVVDLPDQEKYWRTHYLFSKVELSGENLARAQIFYDERQQPYVSLDLNGEGARLFADLTEKNVDEYMAIMLDETVNSAPVINERIPGGRVKITMGGSRTPQKVLADARSLVTVLNQGAYKAPVYKVHDHEVGASLGHDSVQSGKISLMVGMLLVIFFTGLYYRLSGIFAVTALVLNVLMILGLLVSFNSALTLPGMAGIILTIGMAVDANIIIYERIREELRLGKSSRAAADTGFDKAFWAVVDANITTFIAGVVLYTYGTGPIKG